MFFGTYSPRLDDKGRLFLPAKFREELAKGLVVTRGQERCLYVWPTAEFEAFAGSLRNASLRHKPSREFTRMLLNGATDDPPDKQGRITISPVLRQYASLDRDCVVTGAMNRVEIWDSEAFRRWSEQNEQSFADFSEDLSAP
jgi:MraZ protein